MFSGLLSNDLILRRSFPLSHNSWQTVVPALVEQALGRAAGQCQAAELPASLEPSKLGFQQPSALRLDEYTPHASSITEGRE